MAELALTKVVLKLAWQLFAPRVAAQLQKGDPATDAIRNYLLSEFQKIHEHLNALRRKELAAAVSYLENGYTLLKTDESVAIEEFKKARDAAHVAFGVVAEPLDKLLAVKVAVLGTLNGFMDNVETCGTLCLKYMSRLNSMPEVVKAAEVLYDKPNGGKLFAVTGKATRREVLEGTALINKAAWDYFDQQGIVSQMKWPAITLTSKTIHPVYDMVSFRCPKLLMSLQDGYDGITDVLLVGSVFYVAGSNSSVTNTIAVINTDDKTVRYLVGHSGMVLCLRAGYDCVYSGSFDKTVMVWDANTLECSRILTGHSGSVRSLCLSEKGLYSGGADSKIILWDLETYDMLETLDARKPVMQVLCSKRKFVFSLTTPASVQVWLVGEHSHTFLRDVKIPLSTNRVLLANNFLLALAKDRVEAWSLGSFTPEVKISIGTKQIFLAQSSKYLIADLGNGNIQLFDILTGKAIGQPVPVTGSTGGFDLLCNHMGNMYGIYRDSNSGDYNILSW